MPYLTLAATPTQGKDEVLATLRYLTRGPSEASGNGACIASIVQNLQYSGHYSPHAAELTQLSAQVTTVLNALINQGLVVTTPSANGFAEEAVTGYKLTRNGVLPSRRTRPRALSTTFGS